MEVFCMTLTKAHLIDAICKSHNVTQSQAREIVEAFLKISKDSLLGGEDLLLSGFGKFQVNAKKERRGRNPQTGEKMILDARKVVVFRPSGKLREQVNGK